jgi:hypothetical protein
LILFVFRVPNSLVFSRRRTYCSAVVLTATLNWELR